MRYLKIAGIEYALPKNTVKFENATRYRISKDESQISLAKSAVEKVFESTGLSICDIDLIVSASAVASQLIPNMASLIFEQFYTDTCTGIPCMDINTTCTSFVTALDMISYLLSAKTYKKVLLVASDVASKALNKSDKKTYELFSDAAVAVILEATDEKVGIEYATFHTFPKGAHDTEIAAGASACTVHEKNEYNEELYYFKMKGHKAVKLIVPNLKQVYEKTIKENENIDFIIPHQASAVLDVVLKKVGVDIPYLNIVSDYGNMVSASIPFALKKAIEMEKIKRGDRVLLIGTAAGLTINSLVFVY